MSVDAALREIEAIENMIKPYYSFSYYDARRFLTFLRDLRESLIRMDKEKLKESIVEISKIEAAAAPYRGYRFLEEALKHAKILLNELRKIIGE